MKNLRIACLLPILALFSLQDLPSDEGFICGTSSLASIEGVWIYKTYDDINHSSVYTKHQSFKPDKGGIEFKKDGTILKRQNVGWCGTPPVSYGNYAGKWEYIDDKTIQIEYEYWGGLDTMEMEIVNLDQKTLRAKVTY